jgi:predicted Zn-dependent protease
MSNLEASLPANNMREFLRDRGSPRMLLAIAYVREHKNADALALLVKLRADFPANTVFARALTELDRH